MGYQAVALVLLLAVSVSAMLFDIIFVVIAALLSALIWNYFFIPPTGTFHIGTTHDMLLFLMYFVIALINAVLTFKIRDFERKVRLREERENTIKLYDILFNSLSHELRTPISTIIAAVDTIKSDNIKLNTHVRLELLNEIEKASMRLNRQVENLLNMSRLEAGVLKPALDWCDLNELVYNIISELQQESIHQQIVFEADESTALCKIDRGFLEQILLNLLRNALQYTPENSQIEIDVKTDDNCCTLMVSDNGKGFPEASISSVFNKFYRLPNTATGGLGLGLSIVKGLVEALNGKIVLEKGAIGGATFTIEIPCETSSLNQLKNE